MKALPEAFQIEFENRKGKETLEAFMMALNEATPTSIRINPLKHHAQLDLEKVKWCPSGYYLDQRPIFTLDPAFHAGAYYVQEASSMFVHHVLKEVLGDRKDIKVLDLCAAPGGKSTLIASFLSGQGLLVANEVIKNRAYTLKYNLSKEGFHNVVVTNNDPSDFTSLTGFFDLILVDAPCSGEGMFRKDDKAICEWSPENVSHCAERQKRILSDILPALNSEGLLIYSTCTYNESENIKNIDWLVGQQGMTSLELSIAEDWNIEKVLSGSGIGYQFYPHKVKGEGFFISVLKKNSILADEKMKLAEDTKKLVPLEKKQIQSLMSLINMDGIIMHADKTGTIHAFDPNLKSQIQVLLAQLRIIYCGVSVGIFNKDVFIPDHSLALSTLLLKDFPSVELNPGDALQYLKRSLHSVDSDKKSWMLATYQGNGIGFLKNLGNRINNYLPMEYRILMEIS